MTTSPTVTIPRAHISWPVCPTCNGTAAVPKRGGDATGLCGTCQGVGRLRPDSWRDAQYNASGQLVDPGTDPDLVAAVAEGRIKLGVPDEVTADLFHRVQELEAAHRDLEREQDAATTRHRQEVQQLRDQLAEQLRAQAERFTQQLQDLAARPALAAAPTEPKA